MGHRFTGSRGFQRFEGSRRVIIALLTLLALVALAGLLSSPTRPGPPATAESLPTRLSDEVFWHLITDFSEPNGFFRSDNFLSNEQEYQWVIPTLTSTLGTGGVYLGVGPEQNYSYIVALRPKLAFIVDVRRGNRDLHLLYKAFIEMSADRADFLSRLFARPRPAELPPGGAGTSVGQLFAAYQRATPSAELFEENLRAATGWLQRHHSFDLSDDEVAGLEYVYRAFFEGGPDLNYSFPNGGFGRGGNFPTYADLMTQTDGGGEHLSYLASEDHFRVLGELERNNAIIPLVGNFAGPKALRAVGGYLRAARRHRLGVLHVERRDVSLPAGGRLEKVLRQRRGSSDRREEHIYSIGVEPGLPVPAAKQRAGRQSLDASQFNRRSRPRLSRGPDRRLLRRDCDVAMTTALRTTVESEDLRI